MSENDPLMPTLTLTDVSLATQEKSEMENIINVLTSGDSQELFTTVLSLRKKLSVDENPPIQEIIDLNILSTLSDLFAVDNLKRDIA